MDNDERLRQRVRAHLDDGIAQMDPATAARLRLARQRAVEAADERWQGLRWQPFALALAGLVLAAVLWLPQARTPVPEPAVLDDLEVIAADDSLQFYEELDFYQWLVANENPAG